MKFDFALMANLHGGQSRFFTITTETEQKARRAVMEDALNRGEFVQTLKVISAVEARPDVES